MILCFCTYHFHLPSPSSHACKRRPPSELADSPTELESHLATGAQRGFRVVHRIEDDSERTDEGGLRSLIANANEKDQIRRKHEKLRCADRARRAFSSSPPDEQASRQGTAEASATAKIRVVRAKTLPMSDTGTSAVSKPPVGGVPGGRTRKFLPNGTKIPVIARAVSTDAGLNSLMRAADDARRLAPPSDSPADREKRMPSPAGDPRTETRGASHLMRVGQRSELQRSGIAPPGKPLQETCLRRWGDDSATAPRFQRRRCPFYYQFLFANQLMLAPYESHWNSWCQSQMTGFR